MDDSQQRIRKYIWLSIVTVIAIVLFSFSWHFLHTGKIIITTNEPYKTITLASLDKNGNPKSTKTLKGQGKLSVTVNTGKYLASVQGNSQATTQIINLSSHKTLRYEIDPINTVGVEPVSYQNASSLFADTNELLYAEGSSGNLTKIDPQNNVVTLNSSIRFQTIRWASSSFGVGQSSDGILYTVVGGTVNTLNVPFSYDGAAINFDVSPSDEIYVSHGGNVYEGNKNGHFKLVYSSSSSILLLAAGIEKVAISGRGLDSEQSTTLMTVSASGKIVKASAAGEIGKLAWAPDNQHLIAINEVSAVLYNQSLQQVAITSSGSSVGDAKWLNSSVFFYYSKDELWSYNVALQKAELVANMPLADTITGLSISDDGSYVYVSTVGTGTSTNYAIRRVGLHGQQVPEVIYQLQDILPLDLSDLTLGFINLRPQTPTILISPHSNLGAQTYIQEAQSALQQDGFDISKLNFVVQQAN